MNITVLSRIIEKELDVFHWCLLKIIDNKEPIKEISQLSKIKSALSALIKKELISEINEEYILSDKAKEILHCIEEGVIIINTKETKPFFDVFVSSLFIEIENKIHFKRQTKRVKWYIYKIIKKYVTVIFIYFTFNAAFYFDDGI